MDAGAFEAWVEGIGGLTEAQRRQVLEMLAVPTVAGPPEPVLAGSDEVRAGGGRLAMAASWRLENAGLPVSVAHIVAIAMLSAGAGRVNCLAIAARPARAHSMR